jgi:serine beta-lactamase-like protein LACTB, mitochondrial
MQFCALVIAFAPIAFFGQQSAKLPQEKSAAIEKAVVAEMEKQGLVGAAVGVVQDGTVVYAKGFGFADREKKTKATVDTIFNWASNSKPLAAVLAMQLVEQGKLDLDADVRKYVPEFPAKDKTFTTRQILCHTCGIPHYSNGKIVAPKNWSFKKDEMDPLDGLARFADSPLIFSPGERLSYSSYGYVLLSAVIQRSGGEPFVDQVRKRIVEPLAMKSFQWDVASNGQPHWSHGYMRHPLTKQVGLAKEEAHAWKHGAGGFKSNVRDFAAFAAALNESKLVKKETERLMWTNQKTNDGKSIAYALGFVVQRKGELTVSHGGSQNETKTQLVLEPNRRRGVVVMSNCGYAHPPAITNVVWDAVWDEGKNAKK